jgi:hypothetical protein
LLSWNVSYPATRLWLPPGALLRGRPDGLPAARPVVPQRLGHPHQGTQAREVAGDGAEPASLDQQVADRGRLGRAGDHRQAARVGGQLAQQRISGAAADNVHPISVLARQPLCVSNRGPMPERQAVQDAADDPGAAGRDALAASAQGRKCVRPARQGLDRAEPTAASAN